MKATAGIARADRWLRAAATRRETTEAGEPEPIPIYRAPVLEITEAGVCRHCGGFPCVQAARVVCSGCARQIERDVSRSERNLAVRVDYLMSPARLYRRLTDDRRRRRSYADRAA